MAPNNVYIRRTAQLTSRRCILNIYSTNILTQYFKHAAHSPFFFSLSSSCRLFHNATFFGSCNFHILNTGVLNFKKKSGAKGLKPRYSLTLSSLELNTTCRLVANFMSLTVCPERKNILYPMDRALEGTQSLYRCSRDKNKAGNPRIT